MDLPTLYDHPALYDRVVLPGPCAAFYRDLARASGGPVLELACGTGRLTLPLAGDGHAVVGLDASESMLRQARIKALAAGTAATFVQGEMQSFALERSFALVIVSCNSLAHLTSPDDLRAGLDRIARHLAPGGRLAFDVVNPDERTLATPGPTRITLEGGPFGSDLAVEETTTYDPARRVRRLDWIVQEGGEPPVALAPLTLRQFFPDEIAPMLRSAGLRLLERFGDFERGPLLADSPNQVCIAEADGARA